MAWKSPLGLSGDLKISQNEANCTMFAKPWRASAKLSLYQNLLEGLLKHKLLDIFLRIHDSISLCWGPRIYISNKPPGAAGAAGVGHLQRTAESYMGAKDCRSKLASVLH